MNGLGHRLISTRREKKKTQQLCIVTWKVLSAWGMTFASDEPCWSTQVRFMGAASRTERVGLRDAETSPGELSGNARP